MCVCVCGACFERTVLYRYPYTVALLGLCGISTYVCVVVIVAAACFERTVLYRYPYTVALLGLCGIIYIHIYIYVCA